MVKPQVRNFLRDSMNISDIDGTKSYSMIDKYKTFATRRKEEIEGTYPKRTVRERNLGTFRSEIVKPESNHKGPV